MGGATLMAEGTADQTFHLLDSETPRLLFLWWKDGGAQVDADLVLGFGCEWGPAIGG